MDSGRFVTASTWRAPNPPLRMCGVLYIAGRLGGRAGMIDKLAIVCPDVVCTDLVDGAGLSPGE